LTLATYTGWGLYNDVRLNKKLKEDHAAINQVNYGLFDIQLWKSQALDIFSKRIKSYEVAPTAYKELDRELQSYLHVMYKRYFVSGELINTILQKLEENGSVNKMFITLIQNNLSSQLDKLDLQKEIPGLSAQLVSEIRKNEPQIKAYFQQELLKMVMDDASQQLVDKRKFYYNKYDFDTYEKTQEYFKTNIEKLDQKIPPKICTHLAILSGLILLLVLSYQALGFNFLILGLSLVSVVLLLLGVTLPMIDIDARLNAFSISLMGEPISFTEQTIYFQSKSILDVTRTLWQGQGVDLKIVGILVFMFSIVFPFTKLILSSLYLFSKRLASNRIIQNIIFHLGKWSMADVFVVAMFMAYIGFYGIVTSQLANISSNPNGYAVETLNYSRLAPGALYFTLYTLLSISIGIMINRHSLKEIVATPLNKG
jgi:hypothetical protein